MYVVFASYNNCVRRPVVTLINYLVFFFSLGHG
jgi:hypothetical protein